MKACVLKISELFKMDAHRIQADFFTTNRKQLLIPLYQREYKWKEEKVTSLINDIKQTSKFLGNVILDEKDNTYEIVDGQQRITTCLLAMVAIYNIYEGHPREQNNLLGFVKPFDDNVILKNDSVGEFLTFTDGRICLNIADEVDVYYQSDIFLQSYRLIYNWLVEFNSLEEVRKFKEKLLDCELLILINNNHEHTHPVEQLFLDINEKSQQLDVEDVFKGHCFENYAEEDHEELKLQWIQFKKAGMAFEKFGFKDVNEFIYLYLLEFDSVLIPSNLTIRGRHYLEGKTMDQTEELIACMTEFGCDNLRFNDLIKTDDYVFGNLCCDSRAHANTNDIGILKTMCKTMLQNPSSAIYQKMPVFCFVYLLYGNHQMIGNMAHSEFRKIITNLYIYTSLFILSGQRKSKSQVDHTVLDAMKSDDPIRNTVNAVKQLRSEKVSSFVMQQNYVGNKLKFVYSILDSYNSRDNWVEKIYSIENDYNDEHFIIAKKDKVEWKDGDININISNFDTEFMKRHRKLATNFLIIDRTLNEDLGRKDIVTKMEMIREWHRNRNYDLPNHIRTIFDHIDSMQEYNELKNIKGTNPTITTIEEKYTTFWNAYFNDVNTSRLISQINSAFSNAFRQLN